MLECPKEKGVEGSVRTYLRSKWGLKAFERCLLVPGHHRGVARRAVTLLLVSILLALTEPEGPGLGGIVNQEARRHREDVSVQLHLFASSDARC